MQYRIGPGIFEDDDRMIMTANSLIGMKQQLHMYGKTNMEDTVAKMSSLCLGETLYIDLYVMYHLSSVEKENSVMLIVLLFLLGVLMQFKSPFYTKTCDNLCQYTRLTKTLSFAYYYSNHDKTNNICTHYSP